MVNYELRIMNYNLKMRYIYRITYLHLYILCLGIWVLVGCRQRGAEEIAACKVGVVVALPAALDTASVGQIGRNSVRVTLEDLNMGRTYTVLPDSCYRTDSLEIGFTFGSPSGFYDATIEISVPLEGSVTDDSAANNATTLSLRAYIRGIAITQQAGMQTLYAAASPVHGENHDFVFAELSTAGTQTPQGKNYIGDTYFVLYNNTADTLYADGVVLLESKLKNSQKFESLTPDFIPDYFGADAIYRIPGSGREHPVAPGGTVLIADNAQDHRVANSNSYDLSSADFEWYDQSSSATVTDIDNPDVPNMDKVYCYTATIWTPNRQGNTSFALARFPEGLTDSAFLTDYRQDYDYRLITSAGTFDMSNACYIVPNEWILDCVNTCPRTAYQWLVVAADLDAGRSYVGEIGSDPTRFGKCVRRRFLEEDGEVVRLPNGRPQLQDWNNSTLDMLPAQVAEPTYFEE